jgi:hypothetical protein
MALGKSSNVIFVIRSEGSRRSIEFLLLLKMKYNHSLTQRKQIM